MTANKVKVEIFTHFLTEKQKCVSKWLPLEGDTVGVKFQLAGGRRTESLQEQQVASAAAAHLALQQAVQPQALSQQLASQVDPNAMATAYASRGYQGGGPNAEANAFTPFPWAPGGAVGYQPVIVTLPEGASMNVRAIISADRRYVRCSPAPFFSSIDSVTTFNMSSGATSTGSGGTGGQGYGGTGGGQGGTGGFGGGGVGGGGVGGGGGF